MIYVVDSADRDRIGISKQELVSMLEVSFFFGINQFHGKISEIDMFDMQKLQLKNFFIGRRIEKCYIGSFGK